MRRVFFIFAFMAACSLKCEAQRLGAYYQDGDTIDHVWEFDLPPNSFGGRSMRFGLFQYSRWLDSKGHVVRYSELERERGSNLHRFTEVCFGYKSFVLPMPAAAVAAIFTIILLPFGWLIFAGGQRIITRRGKTESDPVSAAP